MSIMNSVTTQLAQAKHQLEELQSSGADIANVERAKAWVIELDMMLETLQIEVGDCDCSAELLEINAEIVRQEENITILNACVDFVNAM